MGLRNKITKLFIFIQGIIFVAFLYLDNIGGYYLISSYIKYIFIILCFIYTLINYDGNNKHKSWYLILGLGFTLIADCFLLLLGYGFEYGIAAFIIVQQIYGIMLDYNSRQVTRLVNSSCIYKNNLFKRLLIKLSITFFITLLLYYLDSNIEIVVILSIFYFTSILMNTYRAIKVSMVFKEDRSNALFALGMIFFVLCDVNVGLFNLSTYLDLSATVAIPIIRISSLFMWFFYAPSQALIALSTRNV